MLGEMGLKWRFGGEDGRLPLKYWRRGANVSTGSMGGDGSLFLGCLGRTHAPGIAVIVLLFVE